MVPDSVIDWLLDSDPALRWQVERDLVGFADRRYGRRRGRGSLRRDSARACWRCRILTVSGQAVRSSPRASTSTLWRRWPALDGDHVDAELVARVGLGQAVLRGTAELLAANSRWEYDDLPYWGGEVDCCINAWTLANGVWLGADVGGLVDWFAEHRLPDGGWNCEWVEGSTRSSFHSTLNSLKGLSFYDKAFGDTGVRASGEEYLLSRDLFRRLSTGEPVGPWVDRFGYPFRWFYSVLNCADYFREASLVDGHSPDPRMGAAIEMIRAARQPDGTWLQDRRLPGRVWFDVDVPEGEPSKWVTLYASRVLEWWDSATSR